MNTQPVGYKAKAFEARNLAFFFLIALGVPILLGLLAFFGLLKSPHGLNDPFIIPWVLLVLLGPSGAAFIVTGLTEGKPGVRTLWRRFWNRNVSLKWLLVALLLLPLMRLTAGVLIQVFTHPSLPLLIEGSISEVLIVPILLGLFSGIQEEFGWRGYALPRFQAKWNALVSSIILGLVTALWHLPAFFMPGQPLSGRSFWEWLPWWMLIQIVGFNWIFNNTNGNVLAMVLFHATTELSLFAVDYTYFGILLVAAILIVVIFGAKNLVRQKPLEGT
jgi:membrane protease YdiL (CAAX protease family)